MTITLEMFYRASISIIYWNTLVNAVANHYDLTRDNAALWLYWRYVALGLVEEDH